MTLCIMYKVKRKITFVAQIHYFPRTSRDVEMGRDVRTSGFMTDFERMVDRRVLQSHVDGVTDYKKEMLLIQVILMKI